MTAQARKTRPRGFAPWNPRPVKLTGRAVAWPESAIVEWLESRPVSNYAAE